jgi:chromodomain-helicase-DNA-binding protein 4
MAQDIKSVEGIVWESVIVDYCQDSVAKHLKQLKQLPTDFRMVLLSSPLKVPFISSKLHLHFYSSAQIIPCFLLFCRIVFLSTRGC